VIFKRPLHRCCRICTYIEECNALYAEEEFYQMTICEFDGEPSFIERSDDRAERFLTVTFDSDIVGEEEDYYEVEEQEVLGGLP